MTNEKLSTGEHKLIPTFGGTTDCDMMMICRHTSRFLLFWLLCLPIPIFQAYSWATPFICGAIAFFLLGIEHIG